MKTFISDKFSNIKVFGKDFTEHHNDLILENTVHFLENYTNWLHVNNYIPYPHKDWQPRVWRRGGGKTTYTENQLVSKYIIYSQREMMKDNNSLMPEIIKTP